MIVVYNIDTSFINGIPQHELFHGNALLGDTGRGNHYLSVFLHSQTDGCLGHNYKS